MEEDTALSIIDPATINMDLVARPTTPDSLENMEYVLEVSINSSRRPHKPHYLSAKTQISQK